MPPIPFDVFTTIWNLTQSQQTPSVHRRMAQWLAARLETTDRAALLMAFRGCGKSTLVGLYCAWLLYGDPNRRILVLSADEHLAGRMVRNVKRLIERHPATPDLRPSHPDQWASDRFTITRTAEWRDPSMLAAGVMGNITGLRADFVICDDVEVPNTVNSAEKRAELRARLAEIDFILTPGGMVLYVGTPHHVETLYADRAHAQKLNLSSEQAPLTDVPRLVIPLLDPDGQSAWPARFPLTQIEKLRRRVGPSRFTSQMMLEPATTAQGRLNPGLLKKYDAELEYREALGQAILSIENRKLVSASCCWDPAFAAADGKGDHSVIAAIFTDEQGDYWLHHLLYIRCDARAPEDAATQQCRQVAAFLRGLHLTSVRVEINGIGRFLPGLLRQVLQREGVAAAVIEHTARRNKNERITEAFEAVLAAGALHVHDRIWQTPFINEMRDWRPEGGSHDDGLDAVASCLLAEPIRLAHNPSISPRPSRLDWRTGGKQHSAYRDFEV